MPKTFDPRWESFAEMIAAGWTKTDAYLAAGYAGSRRNAEKSAARLAKLEPVRRMMKEMHEQRWTLLQSERASTASDDADWLQQEGVKLLHTAIRNRKPALASRTLERIARACGFWTGG